MLFILTLIKVSRITTCVHGNEAKSQQSRSDSSLYIASMHSFPYKEFLIRETLIDNPVQSYLTSVDLGCRGVVDSRKGGYYGTHHQWRHH